MRRLIITLSAIFAIWGGVACTNETQEGYLTIDPESINIDATEQTFNLTVTSNVHYRINPQDSWITVSETSSEGDARIYSVSVEANTSTTSRTGTVNIIGDNVTPQRLTVNQAGIESENPDPDPDPDPDVEYPLRLRETAEHTPTHPRAMAKSNSIMLTRPMSWCLQTGHPLIKARQGQWEATETSM